MSFVSFPSIEGFHHVVRAVNAYPHLAPSPVVYRGKIKLHGTNAAVRVIGDTLLSQSRTQLITPQADNVGFAKWVEGYRDYFIGLNLSNHTIFGEWCGPGIMKGTAINQISSKVFAIFAIMAGVGDDSLVILEPEEIKALLKDHPSDIHILPWQGESFTADFLKRSNLQNVADLCNKVVSEIEPCDPWVKAVFGIEGTAEGVVYYPTGVVTRKQFSDLSFKAKGEKHKVVKTKQAVQIDPEVARSIEEFIALFVTEARLEQGAATIGGVFDPKNIGSFLKWVANDIIKESVAELEASDLTWDQVQKQVNLAARNWFLSKSRVLQ